MSQPNLQKLDAFERLYADYVRIRLIKQRTTAQLKMLDYEVLLHTKELRREEEWKKREGESQERGAR